MKKKPAIVVSLIRYVGRSSIIEDFSLRVKYSDLMNYQYRTHKTDWREFVRSFRSLATCNFFYFLILSWQCYMGSSHERNWGKVCHSCDEMEFNRVGGGREDEVKKKILRNTIQPTKEFCFVNKLAFHAWESIRDFSNETANWAGFCSHCRSKENWMWALRLILCAAASALNFNSGSWVWPKKKCVREAVVAAKLIYTFVVCLLKYKLNEIYCLIQFGRIAFGFFSLSLFSCHNKHFTMEINANVILSLWKHWFARLKHCFCI